MTGRLLKALGATILAVANIVATAATSPALDPSGGRVEDRQQLRALLDAMEAGLNKLDIEALLQLAQPDVVITWQNGEVSRGKEQVRAYYARMVKSAAPIVRKITTDATLGGPAVFYGDMAIAYGTTVDTFDLTDGLDFKLNANWSTTVAKTDGQWRVAALHFSTNLFDNALLNAAKRWALYAAVAALLLGILGTWLVMRSRYRARVAIFPGA